jgi:hypothetical protein
MKSTREERKGRSSYYHYSSLVSLGGLQVADGGTLVDRDFEARWVQVQKASISSFVRSTLYLDPNNSICNSSSGKCDKTTVSANRAPNGHC